MRPSFSVEQIELVTTDSKTITREDLQRLEIRGLHCGSGQNLSEGFLNTDHASLVDAGGTATPEDRIAVCNQRFHYLPHDAARPFPIESDAFDWVFSEHFIEHIELSQAVQWLKEIHRLLKPGALLRLSTPDLAKYIDGFCDPKADFFTQHQQRLMEMGFKNAPERRAWMINQIFYKWGHRWLYDFPELIAVGTAAGFSANEITRHSFRQGHIKEVAQLDQEVRNDESIYVEMYKRRPTG